MTRPDKFLTNWGTLPPSSKLWGNAATSNYSVEQGSKSSADPCPAGWRVAPLIFFREIVKSLQKNDANGYEMSLDEGVAYYPPTNRLTTSGKLSSNEYVFLWSNSNYVNSTSSTLYGTYLRLTPNVKNNSTFTGSGKYINDNKAYRMNVRCVAE